MANTQKFLDEKGVQHLWSKISMEDYPNNETLIAVLNAIDQTKANKEEIPSKISQLENDAKFTTEQEVEALYKQLSSNTILGFYCIEDVTIVVNGVSTVYPANSNVEIRLLSDDTFEIIPTSDNSIMSLNAFPGALGTYYSWLEGVKQFSNILFDMNAEEFYSKWSQGNQGAYQVQYAQYTNCIFWSDNAYISDVSKRTNYTLYYTSQLPLCYSNIPENTFKAFYLAFNVNSDPNWGNKVYRDSFAAATWATQVFSYYGARTIGIFGHDDPDFNIVLPKDCRGLMYQSTAIENAGTFDAINTTNFGAKSGSWRDAFGQCSSLRNLFIKNLSVNLNISWSPINHESIYFIISSAANTKAITISVSPYTYNLLSSSDFELATSKNITIELITTNYIEDKRLNEIANKADKAYVDEQIAGLVDSAPDTLNTIGELATALQENKEVIDVLNEAIVVKADKTYVDEAIANIPTESDIFIVDCPDGSIISHTFEQIMAAVNSGKAVYASTYGTVFMPLTYVADDNSYIEFHAINAEVTEDQYSLAWVEGLRINSDNTFTIKFMDLLTRRIEEIQSSDGEKDIVTIVNRLIEKSDNTLIKTEQTLTDEELTQVRKNLRFIGKDVEGQTFNINGTDIVAAANAEIFGDYVNNKCTGQWSIVEGSTNIATGRVCHVEGANNQALNDGCHVEGVQCIASGYWSHAEGEMTRVTSYASHAEGSYTKIPDGSTRYGTASGYASHIEGGGCYAQGSCSHSEGLATTTKGNYSHSEGRYTIASSPAQHVEGVANIEDADSKYIHIAGNGDWDARSNAYTLDWDGNGWFAGTVETSSVILRSSTPGSAKKFRLTIDDDGVLSTEEVTE